MATATDALRVAAGEIGYSRWDDPEASMGVITPPATVPTTGQAGSRIARCS